LNLIIMIISINQFHVIVFMCIVLVVWDRVLFQQEKISYNFERKIEMEEFKICKHLFKHSNKISFSYSYLLSSLSQIFVMKFGKIWKNLMKKIVMIRQNYIKKNCWH
jgi:hypothetical protein